MIIIAFHAIVIAFWALLMLSALWHGFLVLIGWLAHLRGR